MFAVVGKHNSGVLTEAGCSIVDTRFMARQTRQGWERLCGVGEGLGLPPAAGARSARDHGAGIWQTGLPRDAFKRTARRLPREWWPVQKRSVVLMQRPLRRSRHERRQPGAQIIKPAPGLG